MNGNPKTNRKAAHLMVGCFQSQSDWLVLAATAVPFNSLVEKFL